MPVSYAYTTDKSFDAADPNARPSGAAFLPSSPFVASDGTRAPVNPWSPEVEEKWYEYLYGNPKRGILSPNKRLNMRFHLQNPNHGCRGNDMKERQKDAKLRNWTQKHFTLEDNQIYRRGGIDSKGKAYKSKYAACDSDALEAIQGVYMALHHAGKVLFSLCHAL